MEKLSILTGNTFFREWLLKQATKKYYSKYFKKLKNKIILEIGCGSGKGTKIILKYFSPKKIVAIDLDPRQIYLAKKNVPDKKVFFKIADATNLKYKNGTFDAVFDYGVIHHLPTPEWKKCLKEIYRVLKLKGKVFLYDIPIESFNTFFGRIIKFFTTHPYDKMYKKEEFIKELELIGFKIIKKFEEKRYFAIIAEK